MKRAGLFGVILLASGSSVALDAQPQTEPASRAAVAVPSAAAELDEVLSDLNRDEQTLRKRLDQIDQQTALAHARAVARGRSYVRLVRAGLLPVGGGFDALVEHATRLERLYRGLSTDLESERKLSIARRTTTEKLNELRAKRDPLLAEQRLFAQAQTAVLAEQERRAAFESAFKASADAAHTAVYSAAPGPSDLQDTSSAFAALRGRMPFPVTGRSEIHSARRASSEGPGLELRAPSGTPVRSVFAGRVAFADAYADYGKTVILDHGSRYYTVSANLAGIDVKVGDEVNAGERLGTVGNTGTGSLLYFEIRAGKDTVDPAEWLGI